MKIAANLPMLFTERPLRERVVAAAAAGFDGVEIQFPYELPALALKEALDADGMPLVLINLPAGDLMSGGAGLAAVPARQDAFAAALQEALSYAAMVRPAWVNVLPGRLAAGVEREQALACLQANLHQAAEAFELLGIGVLVEAINPLDMPGFLVNTPEQLDALLGAVAHPNLAAQYDLYHMARQGLAVTALDHGHQRGNRTVQWELDQHAGGGGHRTGHCIEEAARAPVQQGANHDEQEVVGVQPRDRADRRLG